MSSAGSVEPLTQKWLFNTLPQLHSLWAHLFLFFCPIPPSLLSSLFFSSTLALSHGILTFYCSSLTSFSHHLRITSFFQFQFELQTLHLPSPSLWLSFLPFSACWLCNSAAKADWQGDGEVIRTGWSSTLQVLAHFSPVQAEGKHKLCGWHEP